MDAKYFWVLECDKYGRKPFYAMPDGSWTFEKEHAYKFLNWNEAFEFRKNHPQYKEYNIRHYDFSEYLKFQDEQAWTNPKQTEMDLRN